MQAMADGVVPGNFSLDDVDDDMKQFARLVWSDRAIEVPWHSLKAGLVTTLGFGHVSALVCLAHPFLFWRALDDDTRRVYAAKLDARRRRAEQRLQRVVHGRDPLFVPRDRPAHLTSSAEAKLLVDASARLTSAQPTNGA
jgi:fatty acid synthase